MSSSRLVRSSEFDAPMTVTAEAEHRTSPVSCRLQLRGRLNLHVFHARFNRHAHSTAIGDLRLTRFSHFAAAAAEHGLWQFRYPRTRNINPTNDPLHRRAGAGRREERKLADG